MFLHGEPVESTNAANALASFCSWLEQSPDTVLVAHNGRKFDFPILIQGLTSTGLLDKFCVPVKGFVDSLPLFKKVFPGLGCYKQEFLVKNILQQTYGAHDAIEDTKALGNLITHAQLDSCQILEFSFSTRGMTNGVAYNKEKAKNLPSLSVLVYSGVCKAPTAENIAGSGLNIDHLKLIYQRDGEDGLRNTFMVKNSDAQPRVTSAKRILDTVIPKLVEFFKKE